MTAGTAANQSGITQCPTFVAKQQRIRAAIADCNRYIAEEGARSAGLRPAPVAALLDWYVGHRAKLLAMLA